MIELVISALLLIGAFLSLLGSFGMLRLPDVYTRSHAASKSATLGIISLLLAVFIYFTYTQQAVSGKVLLGIFFVFVTASVAVHMIARAAYIAGAPLWEKSVRDDLEPVYRVKKE